MAPITHFDCDRDAEIEQGAPVMVCNPDGGNYPGTVLSRAPQRIKTVMVDIDGRGTARFPRAWIIRIVKRDQADGGAAAMIDRIIAFLDGLSSEDLDRLPPARLQHFSDLCAYWRKQAEARQRKLAAARPRAGVLSELKNGDRAE